MLDVEDDQTAFGMINRVDDSIDADPITIQALENALERSS